MAMSTGISPATRVAWASPRSRPARRSPCSPCATFSLLCRLKSYVSRKGFSLSSPLSIDATTHTYAGRRVIGGNLWALYMSNDGEGAVCLQVLDPGYKPRPKKDGSRPRRRPTRYGRHPLYLDGSEVAQLVQP